MARADRLERLDAQRVALEAEYQESLTEALRATAGGKWGLFGHNEQPGKAAIVPAEVEHLIDLGEAIGSMRERLMLEPFALHAKFLASRGRVKSDAVGEPKQAQAWLDRMAEAEN
jgi:transposase